jgi:hypothetical protein
MIGGVIWMYIGKKSEYFFLSLGISVHCQIQQGRLEDIQTTKDVGVWNDSGTLAHEVMRILNTSWYVLQEYILYV